MSEQTEKASPKPRKAPAGKRAPRKARPSSTSATEPGRKSAKGKPRADKSEAKARSTKPVRSKTTGKAKPAKANPDTGSNAAPQPPDPATVVFGSNRPTVAPPPPKPESSGLRFSGPSDGVLKSSGPQASAPKAEGLTFSSAKSEEVNPDRKQGATPSAKNGAAKNGAAQSPALEAALTAKPKTKAAQNGKAETSKAVSTKVGPAADKDQGKNQGKTEGKDKSKLKDANDKAVANKGDAVKNAKPSKPATPTKPAIAPQNHGPLIEKSGSRSALPLTLVGLGAVVIGLVWLLSNQAPPQATLQNTPQTAATGTGGTAALESAKPAAPVAPANPANDSPTETGSTASAEAPAATPQPAITDGAAVTLTTLELQEVRDLLQKIGLDSGSGNQSDPVMRTAIRDYQAMAGLPVDGEATPALLEELRAVAALYGN